MPGKDIRKRIDTQIKDVELVKKKRLQIALGASRLFIKKGYGQTSMREISKAAGLTIGNLYDYITKKEDVLYLVFDVFHSIWTNKLEEEGVFEITDPVEQFDTAIQKMLELVDAYRDMVLLMYTESKLLPKDFLKAILEKEGGLVRCFEEILERGIQKGIFEIKEPFFMANVIVYLLSLWPLRGWNLGRQYKVEEVNKHLIEFIKSYLLRFH
jgi:TetR/AcrR family transcriptional regulator, cholesterol catabolism regulator